MIFTKSPKFNTLEECLAFCWKMLTAGADNFKHAFHNPVLVTENKSQPNARTVILRNFSAKDRALSCYCDVRSPKIFQIQNNPKVAWLFYDPKKKFQLRISGIASVHSIDETAENLWEKIRITNRINYTTTLTPGSPLNEPSSGLPDFITQTTPHLLDKNIGRDNFAAILCRFNFMDSLLLGLTGHKRAQFSWKDEQLSASWVVP